MNSRFTPATNLKIGKFVLIPNFLLQKKISKKLQPIRKEPFQTIDKPTDVTYKLIVSKKKKIVQHRNNFLPYYPRDFFYHTTHNNSDNSQKQTIDTNCSPQFLETKITKKLDKNPKK